MMQFQSLSLNSFLSKSYTCRASPKRYWNASKITQNVYPPRNRTMVQRSTRTSGSRNLASDCLCWKWRSCSEINTKLQGKVLTAEHSPLTSCPAQMWTNRVAFQTRTPDRWLDKGTGPIFRRNPLYSPSYPYSSLMSRSADLVLTLQAMHRMSRVCEAADDVLMWSWGSLSRRPIL